MYNNKCCGLIFHFWKLISDSKTDFQKPNCQLSTEETVYCILYLSFVQKMHCPLSQLSQLC